MALDTHSSSRCHSVEGSTISAPSGFSSRVGTPADHEPNGPSPLDIAIVGFAFEFPGASTTPAFWDLLVSGKCAATSFPSTRLSPERLNIGDATVRPSRASFIDRDIKAFDAQLFGMAEDEASATDPQLRILLETTYRALEDAGIPLKTVSGTNTSVYTGCFTADYAMAAAKDPQRVPRYSATGMAQSMLSNRLSSFFNLTGPSVTVDTACSSSLVALDMACRSIATGESSMSIVAGCNLLLTPDLFISLSNLGFLSPDGVSHSFDQRANGYGRGEGFGVLVIKSVSAAIRDEDTIRAVIRATATNQNGRTSLALPSKEMQKKLIEETYHRGGVDMSQTRYFESHGTGTAVGDPLEALAIGGAFKALEAKKDSVIVGALKANIGHLEGAAGIAGVIKTVLVLENGVIPPVACLEKLNPDIDAEFLNLEFPTAAMLWPSTGLRRASVNSFGFGGTNAHAILDDALHYLETRGLGGRHRTRRLPVLSDVGTMPKTDTIELSSISVPRIFSFSANDATTLSILVQHFQPWLENASLTDDSLEELAYRLTEKRNVHEWRTFVVAATISELSEKVKSPLEPIKASLAESRPRLGFIFTGQGAQWFGMGKELMAYLVFRNSVMDAETYLQSIGCDWRASELMSHDLVSEARLSDTNIDDPRYAQPLCTVLQVALVDLLGSFGIVPVTVVGHSSGEIAAAYAAGAISRRSAWKLAYYRGLLSSILARAQSRGRGSMMAVGLSQDEAQQYIDELFQYNQTGLESGILTIACINSPSSVTISGDEDLVRQLQDMLTERNIFARLLKVPVAYHSPHMSAIAPCYKDLIGVIDSGTKPASYISMISSVTKEWINLSELSKAKYWVNNMVSPVQFSSAIEHIGRSSSNKRDRRKKLDLSHRQFPSVTHLLELGPHSALHQPVAQILESIGSSIQYMSAIVRGKAATSTLLAVIGTLHCGGLNSIDLTKVSLVKNRYHDATAKTPPTGPVLVKLPSLPHYPFNHSKTHWSESLVSKNLRLAPQAYNPFLGSPVASFNPLDARWRNRLTLSTMPWLADHEINGEILFPAAGMWVMAVEALTQLIKTSNTDASADVEIVGYELRDTHMLTPLVVPDQDGDDGVEIDFRLRSILDRGAANKGSSAWAEFVLYSQRDNHEQKNFAEICRGSIRANFEGPAVEEGMGIKSGRNDDIKDMISSAKSQFSQEVNQERLYGRLTECGYGYGPTFQGVQSAHLSGDGCAVGSVAICNGVPSPLENKNPVTIHPCDLDSILQLCLPIVEDSTPKETWVPTYMSKLYIPAQGFCGNKPITVDVHVTREQSGRRLCRSAVQAFVSDAPAAAMTVLEIEGAELTMITEANADSGRTTDPDEDRRLCYDLTYAPDITSLNPQQLHDYLQDTPAAKQPDPSEFLALLRHYTSACMSLAAANIPPSETPQDKPHLSQLHTWILKNVPPSPLSPEELIALTTELCSTRLGEIHVNFGTHLPSIFRGEVDPLSILLEKDTLTEYYRHFNRLVKYYSPLSKYLKALAHKNPGLRILEVGAGTGSTTEHVLDALVTKSDGGLPFRQFGRYDFTDISPLFLDRARESFAEVGGEKMRYCVFDVERDDLEGQGLEHGGYDLVIAANVLHATPSLETSLANLHSLLSDGGKLVLVEVTDPLSTIGPFMFGCLDGWWGAAEPWRQNGPVATPVDWERELKMTGFEMETVLRDFTEEDNQFSSIIIAHKVSKGAELVVINCVKTALLVTGWNDTISEQTRSWLRLLEAMLDNEQGMTTTRYTFSEAAAHLRAKTTPEQPLVIVLQDSSTWPSLAHLSPEQFPSFHDTLSAANHIMWIGENTPFSIGPVLGLARVLRKERHGLVFSTVALEPSSTPETLPTCISQALHNFLLGVATGTCPEWELTQIGPVFHIPRVYQNVPLNKFIHSFVTSKTNQSPSNPNKKLKIRQPGLLDTLHFEPLSTTSLATSSPNENEIEIEIHSIGLNFRDCLIALGRIDQDDLGSECAGTVTSTGPNITNFQPGDRVTACLPNSFRLGKTTCPAPLAAKIPDAMPLTHAAAIPINFVTAYHALVRTARLAKGETILIHSGAGGTGQAAVQIANWLGAGAVFVTVGSVEKKRMLVERYGIEPERVLYSRDLSFAGDVRRLTGGKGVDVVLNSLSGDAQIASWECVAPYGRFVEIGKRDIFSHGKLPMYQFARNVSFCAVDLRAISAERPETIQEEMGEVIGLFEQGVLRLPEPVKVFGAGQVEDAFRHLQSGKNAGKVVFDVAGGDGSSTGRVAGSWQFDVNGTYVIAGGLGAMGRIIADWMVAKGARHLVLLSRSGATSPETFKFVEGLQNRGATVYSPSCDAADKESLRMILDHCKAHMPLIKGCIQAAMVLRDGFFEDMNHDSWSQPLRPKIDASWNLHQQLPRDLDFFILFSSVAAIIGSQAQANYAAGNTFQDELARYRLSKDLPALSVNLSLVGGPVGFSAEHPDLAQQFILTKHILDMSTDEVLGLLDYHCNAENTARSSISQIVLGLDLPQRVLARNMDLPAWMNESTFANLHQITDGVQDLSANTPSNSRKGSGADYLRARAEQAESVVEAATILSGALVNKLCKVLGRNPNDLDPSQPLYIYGVDSLVAVELRNWLREVLKVDVAVFEILGGSSCTTIAQGVARKILE